MMVRFIQFEIRQRNIEEDEEFLAFPADWSIVLTLNGRRCRKLKFDDVHCVMQDSLLISVHA